MAIIIRHGPNGSYKSASIVKLNIIENLQKGRVVVTNMEGMFPLDIVKEKTGFEFPESAQIIRIGSLTEKKKELWRNWFSWMPLDVVIVIDECQSIYKKSFKGGLTLRPFSEFERELPQALITLYHERRATIKATDFDSGDTDDMGDLRFNEDGTIIYPDTLEDSFERHRKYNWDIVFGTPNIKEIAANIKACAETAFAMRARDEVFFTRRKPRAFEHKPDTNGTTVIPEFCTTVNIPLWVFLCYKSTQTGSSTKSGQRRSPFKNPKFIGIMGVVCVAIYFMVSSGYAIYSRGDDSISEQTPEDLQANSENVSPVLAAPAPVVSASVQNSIENIKHTEKDIKKDTGVDPYHDYISAASVGNAGLNLPYSAITLYLAAYILPTNFVFKLTFLENGEQVEYLQTADELALLGWIVLPKKKGLVVLKNSMTDKTLYAMFDPKSKFNKSKSSPIQSRNFNNNVADNMGNSQVLSAVSM